MFKKNPINALHLIIIITLICLYPLVSALSVNIPTGIYAGNYSEVSTNYSETCNFWDLLDTPADINTADLTDDGTYWKSNGSSTATGNWDLGAYNIDAYLSSFFDVKTNSIHSFPTDYYEGQDLEIYATDGSTSGPPSWIIGDGGNIIIYAGEGGDDGATAGDGGVINISSGNGGSGGTGDGGDINLISGFAQSSGKNGDLNLFTKKYTEGTSGGNINLTIGTGGNTASIILNAGGGNIKILSPLCNSSGSCFSLSELNKTNSGMDYTNLALINQSNVFNGNLTAKGLNITGSVILGNAVTDYHSINTIPNSNYMIKEWFSKDTTTDTYGRELNFTHNYNGVGVSTTTRASSILSLLTGDLDPGVMGPPDIRSHNGIYDAVTSDMVIQGGTATLVGLYGVAGQNGAVTSGTLNIYGLNFGSSVSGAVSGGTIDQRGTNINVQGNLGTAGTMTKYGNYISVSGTADNSYGFYGIVSGATNNWFLYNNGESNNFMGNDNSKTYFGTGKDASIYYDATNLIFNTNNTGNGIAWFSNNISAQNLIDRSWYWDKSLGNSLDYVKDSDEISSDKDLYNFEKAVYLVTDFNNCWEVIDKKTNETYMECGTKEEVGRLVSATIGKHEQNIYDLKEELELYKTCLISSKTFEEYKECVLV